MAKDTFDIQHWIGMAPLNVAESHIHAYHSEQLRMYQEWYSRLPDLHTANLQTPQDRYNTLNDKFAERDIPNLDNIVSPLTLAYIEQYRIRHRFDEQGWPSRSVDAIVWALGEPPSRDFTKIGGLPYRPADLPWPRILPDAGPYPARSGEPMTFLGQINFSCSLDLEIPPLPNDVLLIFTENQEFARPECLHFEWYPLAIPETELIAAKDVMAPAWEFVTCHGFRHRTVEYIPQLPEEFLYYYPKRRAALLDCSKLGGFPNLVQSDIAEFQSQLEKSGNRFLAQIRSIYPPTGQYYPWLNQYEPNDSYATNQMLEMGDDGSIYLLVDESGEISWTFECG